MLGLAAIITLGAFLRFYQLGLHSIGNTYYAATVQSMLTSWHNFFYASFEPGGSVTVDKPPLGFWIQAASAYMLGVNGFALALPQALAGTLSIPLLFILVRRHFGRSAGLIAALVLAATPVAISTERNNTIDGLLLFTLLLAIWAFIKAVEAGRLRYLLLGAGLVGVGFNIKMMQAFLPLPALYAFYFLGAPHSWLKRIVHLAVATVLLAGVSLSWAIAVDLTPPENRPYIGSSTNNTVLELIVGHNGLNRLWGPQHGGGGPPPSGRPQPGQFGNPPSPQNDNRLGPAAQLSGPTAGGPGSQPGSPPPFGNGRPPGPGRGPGGGGPGGPDEIGQPGPLRLFTAPLVMEAGWLLPLALLSIPLTLGTLGRQWPLSKKHLALLLWAGWLVTEVIFFSIAAFFHAYYLLMLGPPLAALIGIVSWSIWKRFQTHPGRACMLLVGLVGGTIVFQLAILPANYRVWVGAITIFLAIAGLGLFTLSWWQPSAWAARFGFGLAVLAVTVSPLVWSGLTTFNDNSNVALPRSGPMMGGPQPPGNSSDSLSASQQVLLDYLLAHNTAAEINFLVATASSHEASPYILATQRPVLTFGGFNGGDDVVDAGQLARLVADGKLRFILGRQERKPEIATWITENCTVVEVPGISQAEPPSVDRRPAPGSNRDGEQANILFDCAGYEGG